MKVFYPFLLFMVIFPVLAQNQKKEDSFLKKQEEIIAVHHTNCALQYNYRFQMNEWQTCLDKGLEKDSTIAYLWQQKAMPYFKAKKYEVGMEYLDKAVFYDKKRWLPYRAFIKCIFSKSYVAAIADFEAAKEIFGNSYEMDHSYDFYIGLSYLQLNKFAKAEQIFANDIKEQIERRGEAHYLDLFYYGIALYEQQKWQEAIIQFDKALDFYNQFSDAKYYKYVCLFNLGAYTQSENILMEAQQDAKNGFTINEDNAVYETYPYQIK